MKAILVFDMPKSCEECRLINRHYDNEYGWQTYCGADYHRIREKNKKYFCPLKPLPQLKGIDDYHDIYDLAFSSGWNNCISKIVDKSEYELMVKEKVGEEE